jgi:hypothetical protein
LGCGVRAGVVTHSRARTGIRCEKAGGARGGPGMDHREREWRPASGGLCNLSVALRCRTRPSRLPPQLVRKIIRVVRR